MASTPRRSPSASRSRSWLTGIAEAAEQLPRLRSRVLVASLGGPVGTLAGLGEKGPAVARAFAEDLGLGAAPIAWHALRARMAEAGAWLAILIGALAKMATDVAHLASTEVGEVGGAAHARPRRLLGHAAQAQPGLRDGHPRRPCRREGTCRHAARRDGRRA